MEVSWDDKEVQAKLQEIISNTLPEKVEQALEQACLIVEGEAKSKCPVDSGQLKGSITHKAEQTEGVIFTNVEYAPYVEVGTGIYSTQGNGRQEPWKYKSADGTWHTTSGMKAQPFMKPAAESSKGQIIQCFEGIL